MGEIELYNQIFKERVRGIYNTKSFNKMPQNMIVELVSLVISGMNSHPPSPYAGGGRSPRQVVTRLTVDYNNHCRPQFGEYAKVHESHENMMQEKAMRPIALIPTGNTLRAYFFMRLANGWRLNRQKITPILRSQDVINIMHHLEFHNTRVLDIQDIYHHLFVEAKDRAKDEPNNSTYAPSDGEDSVNSDGSDNNNTNMNSPLTKKWDRGP